MSARFDSLDSDGGPGPERCQFLRKGWMYGHGSRFTATIIVCLMVLKIKYVAVVMGASASAEDISREIAKVAKEVHIASRSFKTGSSAKLLGYENVWRHPMVEALSTDGGVNFPNGIVIYADTILHCTGLVSICHRDLACIPAIWDRNLQGVLPPTLVKLPFLKIIDLTRNYLSGTIIPE